MTMTIDTFMQGYREAWESRDEQRFCALFTPDGQYHNTPFAVQTGPSELAAYWQRVKLQQDVEVTYDVLARHAGGGVAHWRTTYQVASEELFRIWAASTGTNLIARHKGEALPRLALDGIAMATFGFDGLCHELRLWWHSKIAG